MIRFRHYRLNAFEALMTKSIFLSLLFFVFLHPAIGAAEVHFLGSRLDVSPAVTAEEEKLFNQSRTYLDQGNTDLALGSLEQILMKYPESVLLPGIYLQLASAYAQNGELRKTVGALKLFLQKFPAESRLNEVRLKLSQAYLALGDLKEVMAFWADIPGDEEIKMEVYTKVVQIYFEQKDYLNALHVLDKKNELDPDLATKEVIRNEVISIVRDHLQERELQILVKQYGPNFPTDEAMIRLAEIYHLRSDSYREKRELKRLLSLFPNHPFSAEAINLIGEINEKIKSDRYLIGVALHLSGALPVFGENALNGAQLAMDEFKETRPGASVGLVVKNLDAVAGGFESIFQTWLDEYNPVAVVGPLLSKEVEQVSPIVEKAGLFLITPGATVSGLSRLGSVVFRNAMTSRFQCRALAEYSVLKMRLKHFAILFPKENFGRGLAECFSEEVRKLGGDIVHVEPYPVNEPDFSPVIRRLKDADLEKGGIAEIEEDGRRKKEISYSPRFQAIFLPGDAQKVGLLIPQLAFHNIKDTVLLGTSGWDTPDLVRLAGPYAEGATFIDGFFRESPEPIVREFVRRYRLKFQQEPDLFAAQAYDATRLILSALEGGAMTPQDIREVISKSKNFPGASGLIYEVKEGEIIKKPFFVQVHKKKLVQVEELEEDLPPASLEEGEISERQGAH